jgi:hypothetical protein
MLLLLGIAPGAAAQAALVSDLWRVAAGTLVQPAALGDEAAAAFWTPAVVLPASRPSLRLGVEMIHAPSELGVNGSTVAISGRLRGVGTASLVYGRIGLDNLVRTETSPEALAGSIPAYAEAFSLGLARGVGRGLDAGVAVRYLAGRLADRSRTQLGVDVGLLYTGAAHLRLGAATRFWDPLFGAAEEAATYSLGAEWASSAFDAWGTTVRLAIRYGSTGTHGEELQHLLTAGMLLGGVLALDLGAARESSGGLPQWSSRGALGITSGHYRVQVGRDGGVNGFGATYRFGLAAEFQ